MSGRALPQVTEVLGVELSSLLFPPRYSPELNPIEKLFFKIKARLRKANDELWRTIAFVCELF